MEHLPFARDWPRNAQEISLAAAVADAGAQRMRITPETMQLLFDVWREACRHIEIGELVARIAPRIAQRVPLDRLLVRRVELERLRLETLATGGRDARGPQLRGRTEC